MIYIIAEWNLIKNCYLFQVPKDNYYATNLMLKMLTSEA